MALIHTPIQAKDFGIVALETSPDFDIEAGNSLDAFGHLHHMFVSQFVPFFHNFLFESFDFFLQIFDGQVIVSVGICSQYLGIRPTFVITPTRGHLVSSSDFDHDFGWHFEAICAGIQGIKLGNKINGVSTTAAALEYVEAVALKAEAVSQRRPCRKAVKRRGAAQAKEEREQGRQQILWLQRSLNGEKLRRMRDAVARI